MPPRLFELLEEETPDWVEILEASTLIEEAKYVDPLTNLTPLHLAIMAKKTSNGARIGAIRSLLQSNLTATEVICHEMGYTPLMYACRTQHLSDLEDGANIVRLLLEFNPHAFRLTSPCGHSAIDVHIMSISKIQQESSTIRNMFGGKRESKGIVTPCTLVLKVLTEYDFKFFLTKSLDLLLQCNTYEIMEWVAQEELTAFGLRLRDRQRQRMKPNKPLPVPSGSRHLKAFWVWECVLLFLRSEHEHTYKDEKPIPPFNALHTATQVPDFPLPFLMLCMRAYPAQVYLSGFVNAELPIHSVATWDCQLDAEVVARKSMSLTQLLSDHPSSSRSRNEDGKTPLTLAIETGTGWNSGIRRLTSAQKEDSPIRRRLPVIACSTPKL